MGNERGLELLPEYLPLANDTRYFVVTGSRGSAKSFHLSLFLLNLSYEPGQTILFTRWTLTSAYISIIPEFLEKIEILNAQDDFEINKTEIVNKKTGVRILFRGIKTSQGTATANLKSIQGVTCWVLDEAEELTDDDVFDRIDLSVRAKNHHNRVIMVMNPSYKTHFIYKRFIQTKRKDTTYIHTTYLDNKKNLSESFLHTAETTKQTNLLRYNHLFLGHWLDEAEGILWNARMIERQRIDNITDFDRVIVSVDPATTKTMQSDETGIVVIGKKANHTYIIEDLSGKYSPQQWAKVSVQAAKNHKATAIIAEKNQGGDMVEAMIRQEDKNIRVKLVTATKGKQLRAEPIYALYEQGRVWHVGNFPKLESQMVTFNPDAGGQSPDRVDALVHGITELVLHEKKLVRLM
jgi:PBSX family phage terminase large subunit